MKLLHKSFNMLVAATLLAFIFGITSCSDDEPGEGAETNIPEKGNGEDFVFDDAGYFEDNFFGFDSLGNSYDRKVGYALDSSDPQHLYVGADSHEDAKNKFLLWLAPGYESKLTYEKDGRIIYTPTDEEDNPQGQIIYTPNDDGYKFATVSLTKDTQISTFREVTIIRHNGFPDNNDSNGDFIVEGDYVGAKAWHKNPEEWPLGSLVGVVIRTREPEWNRAGIIVFITPKMGGRDPLIEEFAPTVNELSGYIGSDFTNSAVSKLKKPVSYLVDIVNDLGITLKTDFGTLFFQAGFTKFEDIYFSFNETEFWSRTKDRKTFAAFERRYVSTLSGKKDWYSIQKPANPQKRVIFFRYYN